MYYTNVNATVANITDHSKHHTEMFPGTREDLVDHKLERNSQEWLTGEQAETAAYW